MGEMLQTAVESGLLRARLTVEESPSEMKDFRLRETVRCAANRAVKASPVLGSQGGLG